MQFTDLTDVPVKIKQVTPHIYGSDDEEEGSAGTPGASLSCRITLPEGEIELNGATGETLQLWDDESVSAVAKVMKQGGNYPFPDLAASCTIKTSNGDAIFHTESVHRMNVTDVTAKPGRKLEWKFSVSFYNNAGTLFAAQKCMNNPDDLTISIELDE